MTSRFDLAAWFVVALGAHVTVFAGQGADWSSPGAQANTGDVVSLATSPPGVAAMVEAWNTAPSVASDLPSMSTPMIQSAPDLPTPTPMALPPDAPASLPVPQTDSDAAPAIDTTPPPPPVTEQAVAQSLRPQARQPRREPPQTRTAPQPTAPPRQPAARTQQQPAPQAPAAAPGGNGTTNAPAAATAPRAVDTGALMARWGGSIRSAIERRKRYPRGETASGTVQLTFVVSSSGGLVSASISGSSGNAALDQAAMTALRSARLPRAPSGLPGGQHRFTIPLTFSR